MRLFFVIFTLIFASPVFAAEPLPVPPELKDIPALQKFVEESQAEIKYMSRQYGVDMWIATKNDIAQVIYTTPDGRGMLMNGFLFAPDGSLVTEQAMNDFAEGEGSVIREQAQAIRQAVGPKTPGEKLWAEMGKTNYVEFGSKNAPMLYVFVDPFCPYCKEFWQDIAADYVAEGKVNLRLIPVGILTNESADAAAYIVNQNDRAQAWLNLVAASLPKEALVPGEKGMDGIKDNFNTMQKWKIESTPFSIYQSPEGKTKMYRGKPDDMAVLMRELGIETE